MLVPLFGVHYMVFLGMSYSIGVNETVEIVWLFCDQLFASFQVKVNNTIKNNILIKHKSITFKFHLINFFSNKYEKINSKL